MKFDDPQIEAIDATLGAVITNINLANLTETHWQLIDTAFNDYALLVFPDQYLSAEAQVIFPNILAKSKCSAGRGWKSCSNKQPKT